jgi:osmoprotectant transport system permease protein
MRTATVWTVGMATLSTPVGATSLGNYIFSGLQTRNFTAVLVGSVSAAALALVLDGLVHGIEGALRERRRGALVLRLSAVAALFLFAMVTLVAPVLGRSARSIKIGSKTFTEQYILADIVARQLERAGFLTETVSSLGSTVVFDALRTGDIDVYVDYTGTLWANVLGRPKPPASAQQAVAEVARFLSERDGITLIGKLGFENTYALAMRAREADRIGARTIGDLVPYAPQLKMGADYELFSRPEWRSLESTYGLRFAELRSMDPTLMYQAVAQGSVDVISAFSTDGRIEALELVVLEDDRHAIPPYDAVILASRRLVTQQPEAVRSLEGLVGTIDEREMRAMNLAVDESGEAPSLVAERFLASRSERKPIP